MKYTLIILLAALFISSNANAQFLKDLQKKAEGILNGNKGGFTSEEAVQGIKEALIKGTTKGTDFVSKVDGFYKNPDIKILFPPEAKKVESTLRSVGLNKQCDDAILSLNRAAEDASKSAKDIFISAIKGMTVNDAINIVKGDTTAATKYLQAKTTTQLTKAFTPIIQNSLDKVDATKYWKDVMTAYNKVPFVEKVNPDLKQYVTQKAMDALFLMIAREEVQIRKDPIARTSEILKKVFGR